MEKEIILEGANMIKNYGKKRYTLAGAYKDKKPAMDLVKAIRSMSGPRGVMAKWYARLEKCLNYANNPPSVFYRVWQRKGPEPRRRK